MRTIPVAALLLAFVADASHAQPTEALNRIIDQGLNHSQVMQTAQYLMDRIGSRMTNSPGMRQAEAWTQSRFQAWGLRNVRKEGFAFGRGWSINASSVRMVSPRPLPLVAIPIAWTPPTNGALTAEIVVAPIKRERDFATWRGKLKGKIVLVSLPVDRDDDPRPVVRRLTSEEVGKLDKYQQPTHDPEQQLARRIVRITFASKLDAFLKAEGAVAWARMARRDGKLVHGEGYTYRVGATPALPAVEIAAEDYRRLTRLAKVGPPPKLEIRSDVAFDDRDRNAYNIFAEIPGSDPRAGYVMAGAHLDSWAAADGATDNGAGSAVVMEAARILAATGVRPKRTIRFVLWAGEEQGLLGSMAYVEKHLATRAPAPGVAPNADGIEQMIRWTYRFPITPLPGHRDLMAYFNIDNGSGRLHGLHAEGNVAAVPVLREWLQPFASMGASSVVASPTGGTDHVFLQAIGLPGYQFIQDPLDYESRTHHSSVDTFDHLKAEDLRQASVVLAGLLYQAATSAKTLPRMPIPTRAEPTNPFVYPDPDDD